MALADIPFYGAYLQRKQQIEQEPMQQLQQASGAMGLLASIQQQKDAADLRQVLADSGGDPEVAMAAAIKSGNVKAAHELMPLAKLQQEKKANAETPGLLASIYANQGGTKPAPPVAPDIPTASPADAMVTPQVPQAPQDARAARLAALKEMSLLPKYANNAIVGQRLQAEIDKLEKPEYKTRTYQSGDQSITEELQPDGTWKELGRGPKFAKTIPDETPGPTADTIEMDAWRYLTDGTLPPNMGRGQQGAKQATDIRNRSAQLAKDMGMSPDEIRMAQLTNKTQVQAIGQLAKAKAQILQFEKTASMNADLALQASDKVDRTGVPVINRWIQAGRQNITGDPEATAFHAATETFVNEYAKVMSGGYGSAATTEGAQNRAHTLLNTAQNKETFSRVVQQLKSEMDNRVKALNGQMEEEKSNLRRGIHGGATPAAPAQAVPAPANVPPPPPGFTVN